MNLQRTALATVVWLLCVVQSAWADDYDDVANLMRNGRTTDALARIEQFLQTKPRDAQMRFNRGLIERDSGKLAQAQATFLALTQDYPELPEPHNNLAVVYAALNDLDQARASLEAAIRNNPNYPTAHENLGDVLSRMAAAAWARARALDASNTSVVRKINLLQPVLAAGEAPKPMSEPTPAPTAARPTVAAPSTR
jgi:Flp pilus assembly protein TadD